MTWFWAAAACICYAFAVWQWWRAGRAIKAAQDALDAALRLQLLLNEKEALLQRNMQTTQESLGLNDALINEIKARTKPVSDKVH